MPKTTNQKEQIVQAGLKLFASSGYGGASVRQIARAAKVSAPLMYNYFKSKEDLLFEIINRGFKDIATSLEIYTNKNLPPRKAIEIHVRKTFEIISKHREFWRLLHSIRLQDKVLQASSKMFSEMVRSIKTIFTAVFKKLRYKKPDLEALLFLSQIDGLTVLYLQDASIPLNKLAQQLIDRYQK